MVCVCVMTLAVVGVGERRLFRVCDRCPICYVYKYIGLICCCVLCVCETIQLFCVVFCVVRAVGKLDFWLVNEKKNYVMQW